MANKIVIIEDNKELIDFIKEYLENHGEFNVDGYTSGVEALKILKNSKPDLTIVDLGLNDIRGETICEELRKEHPSLPIIVLTGDKSHESVIHSLNAGADDYITKPFNAEELLARINARLRAVNGEPTSRILTSADLELNLDTLEVQRAGKKIDLTAKEFELLKFLLMNKSRILSREKILDTVWGFSPLVETRVVDVHVGKLRKKVESGFKTTLIETVRGFGYKMGD
jgi:DNA-binding response OmpR family regulator